MRIRVALGSVYPYNEMCIRGGVEAAALALTRGLAVRNDIEMHVVACHPDVRWPHSEKRGNVTFHWLRSGSPLRALREATIEAWHVRNVYLKIRPDIIHAQASSSYSISTPPGVPVLLTIHGLEVFAPSVQQLPYNRGLVGHYRRLTTNWMLRRSLRRADALISVAGDYVSRTLGSLLDPNVPTYAISNAVNDEFFSIPDLSIDPLPVVLCPAEVGANKNQLNLVRAFASLKTTVPEARLVLAGGVREPSYHKQVVAEIARLGLIDDVSLPGRLNQSDLLQAYNNAAVVTLASMQETAPMSLTQAMAAGRPVVATRVGGVDWIVKDHVTGLLVERGNNNSLAEQLAHILKDARLRNALGAAARIAAYQRFSGREVAEQTVAVYRSMLSI